MLKNRKYLIVNADDLALHPAVNQAIFHAHREGIVTSSTILTCGRAFAEALRELKSYPNLGIGIHLCLVEQIPILNPEEIPSLIDEKGRFFPSHIAFIKRYISGKIRLNEVKLELEAQVRRALDSGLKPTHLDSHQHLHLLPGISQIAAQLGEEFGIRRIRIPAEDIMLRVPSRNLSRHLQKIALAVLANYQRRLFYRLDFKAPEHFAGFSCGGCCDLAIWRQIIPVLKEGTTEVMVHPGADDKVLDALVGSGYHWEGELQALLHPEVKSLIHKHEIQLINFRALS